MTDNRPSSSTTENDVEVSFEFFPPQDEAAARLLWSSIERLAPLEPRFVSVTYGAGGSTRARTHAVVGRIMSETPLTPAAHLTCVGAARAEIDEIARHYLALGVRHIVALRGDPPAGASAETRASNGAPAFQPHPAGYADAAELVAGLKRVADFEISVAAYPETHREAKSPQSDLDHLKRKFGNGATRAITQFFCAPSTYLRFVERARQAGITAEIVPGILPVTNYTRFVGFAERCGVAIPDWFTERFEGLDHDPETRRLIAASVAIEQCTALRDAGVRRFHFYTLNRPELTRAICHALGVRAASAAPMSSAADIKAEPSS
jgi:methylenetetrahydrofolate reductase (NADPH)